jgi:hypothetical protein
VATVSDRPARKPPIPTSSHPRSPSVRAGIRKPSPPPGRSRSTARSASSGLPIGRRASRDHARRSIDESGRRPIGPTSSTACVHSVCVRPPPGSRRTGVAHRSRCTH